MTPLLPDPYLRNQSHVRFTSGRNPSAAYSNIVSIPLYGPAISVRKETDARQAELGSTIVYRLIVSNAGNAAADVTLYDALPAGTSIVSNSVLRDGMPLPGADPPSGIPLGDIAPGGEARVSFQLIVTAIPESREISNSARAAFAFATPEGRISRGETISNEVTIPVIGVKVSAAIRTRWSQTFAGDIVYYDVVVTNEGSEPITGVTVSAALPQGLTFLAGSVTVDEVRSPAASPASGIAVGSLAAGGSAVVAFAGQVGDLPNGTVLPLEAIVRYAAAGTPGVVTTNEADVVVVRPAVSLSMSANPGQAAPGDTITYTAIVYNASRIAIEGTLLDLLPAGLRFVPGSASVNGIRIADASPEAGIPLGTVAPEGRALIVLQALIPARLGESLPTYTNEAQLTYAFRLNDGRAVRATVASNTVATRIVSPLFAVKVAADPPEVYPGDEVIFRAEVRNAGNAAASVILEGLLPAGVRLSGYGIRVDGWPTALVLDGSVALGIIAPGASCAVAYRVVVPENTAEESLEGYMTARYAFELNGRAHTGEARSNEYLVLIEGIEE
ncbi:hypothetical protein [Cohnella sp. JJ-181]|uniref:hypothetical protein n=1 Tax=Cohnella rhizoplanae TaxID=2974897 RepID=UPI0022FFC326|nr:hypothetical protein [Cohnella sp. JJ-181]CAI6033614.1 hypothetical protein COHCIP112018_00805 [Cohnella sp. JJ-181]